MQDIENLIYRYMKDSYGVIILHVLVLFSNYIIQMMEIL